MQVTELKSQGLKKNYKIVVASAQIDAQLEVELRTAGERVKIPGFRPGYIPMKVLRQRYGKSVQGDVLKQVINKATTDVVAQNKLRPAITPQINIDEYKEGGDLAFTVSLETFPDMPEIAFDKLTLNRKTFDIADADIDAAQERIAQRTPNIVAAKSGAKAESGNVITIDFKGMKDGVAFDGGTATDFDLELGSKQFIEGFEEQLIGVKAGDEREVKVTFPEKYPSKDLAGQPAVFEVKVKEVKVKEPAAIDDAFAKARGFDDVAKLREAIKGQMTNEYNQLVRNNLKKELFDQLEKQCDFELPQGMVDMEFNAIWERLKQAQTQGDDSVADKNEDELKEEYQQIARRRVKLGLLLADIGNRNKIQISREEMTRAIMQQASGYPGQEQMVMEFYKKNPDRVEDLRGPILEEKAVDFVLAKAKFNDTKVSLEELAEEEDDEATDSSAKKKKPAKSAAKKKAAGDKE